MAATNNGDGTGISLPDLPSEIAEILRRIVDKGDSDAHLSLPRKSLAGVLILLCLNANGELCVILTTRALTMRSFPGETALPGGRMEDEDGSVVETALREAREEIGLGLEERRASLQTIGTMEPFLSKNLLFVVPVVAFTPVSAETLLEGFTPNAAEVGAIWSWPLKDLLGHEARPSRSRSPLATEYSYTDVHWLSGRTFRLHEFQAREMKSPITGLTADILMTLAMTAYGLERPYSFERYAKNQLTNKEMIKLVLEGKAGKDGDTRSSTKRGVRVTEDTVAAVAAAATAAAPTDGAEASSNQ